MEKTKFTLFMLPAVALFLFVACSGENDLTAETPTAQQKETPSNAIGFDAYLNRTTTRAGWAGELNLTNLQSTGFGVFAYYGDGDLYSENLVPNFMYNQHVTYAISTDKWTYEPVKYWPNEFGSSAVSVGVDRVSFFAYAPYVAVEPSSGLLTSDYDGTTTEKLTEMGITWLSRNGKGGDPYVRYVTSFESAKCVDLCYGLAAENFTSSVDGGDGINNVKKGQPYLNVAKPTTDSRIKFDFKHALAKLKVQVDADVDVASHSDGGDPDVVGGMTRVWVRSITFEGVSQRGFLNMRTGAWHEVMDGKKISHATVTIYDGRRDGSEAISDDTYEEITGFNSALVQSGVYTTDVATGTTFPYTTFTSTTTGVTEEYKDLFDGTGELMVIPANEQLKVTIVYDVETADATLPNYLSDGKTKGSTIENKITKAITLGGNPLKLESGNAYTINLHLGLNSVKFDATVSGWDAGNGSDADNTWLPENVPSVTAGSTTTINVPAAGGTFTYKIAGLTASSVKTPDKDGTVVTATPTWTPDNPSSSGIITFTVPANTTVSKKTTGWVNLTETGDGTTVTTINITQPAAALGLGVSAIDGSAKTITLSKTATGSEWSAIVTNVTSQDNIKVTKNSTDLTGVASSLATGQFTFDTSTGVITLYDAIAAGDSYTIYVKGGDAVGETFTAKIGQFAYAIPTVAKAKGSTFTNPLTKTGTGTVTYSSSGTHTIDANGKVTLSPTTDAGKFNITATVTNDPANGWFYLTNTADYTLNIGDVVFTSGGNYVWNRTSSSGTQTITICGLKASTATTVAETSDADGVVSSCSVQSGYSSTGTADVSDADGFARVTALCESNTGTTVKTATLTVTNDGKTMTITIKQAAPAP